MKEYFVKDGRIDSEMDKTGIHSVWYLNDHRNFEVVRTLQTPINRSRTGYGAKLPTQYMVHDCDTKRYHRVYAICYSNAASLYASIAGVRYFLRDCDIPENPRPIGVPDRRYAITLEWTGAEHQKYVLRFCGDWVSAHDTESEASAAAEERARRAP